MFNLVQTTFVPNLNLAKVYLYSVCRVAPDTELAGYPANLFCRISGLAGYPVSGRISGKNNRCHTKKNGWHFLNNFYSFRNFTVIFSGDLGFEERIYHVKFFWLDIRLSGQPDIRLDTGYKKRPDIRCNPSSYPFYIVIFYIKYLILLRHTVVKVNFDFLN